MDSRSAGPLGLSTRPAASPKASTASGLRYGPCPCRLACPDGSHSVRPRPLRAWRTPLLRLLPRLAPGPPQRRTWMPSILLLLQFGDSVACYWHTDCAREQQAEPACHAATGPANRLFVVFAFALAPFLLGDAAACQQRPAAHHRRRHRSARPPTDSAPPRLTRSTRWGSRCLLNDEPVRIYVPLIMLF